ncbi:hypothetical protein ACWEN3_11510 [Streptomyces sp. NPDC004561]
MTWAGRRGATADAPEAVARTRPEAERARTATYRWLLETAVVAGRWYEPEHGAPPAGGRGMVDLSDSGRAREWLQVEGAHWLTALRAAAAAGEYATVVEVAESLHWLSDQWIFRVHWPEVFAAAARSARALDEPLLEATQLDYHAWALLIREDRPRDSRARSGRAPAAAERAGDPGQQAWAHNYGAWAHRLLDEPAEALEHNERAGRLFEAAGDLHGSLQSMRSRALGHDPSRGDAERSSPTGGPPSTSAAPPATPPWRAGN